jgi:hypothetical protein
MVNSYLFDRLISLELAIDGLSTQIASREGDALPDSQAGYFQNVRLGILSGAGDDQCDSANRSQSTEEWRDGDVLLLFSSGVNRANVYHFFLMSVIEALIGEGQAAKDNQQDPNHHCRFHSLRFPIKQCLFGLKPG